MVPWLKPTSPSALDGQAQALKLGGKKSVEHGACLRHAAGHLARIAKGQG